MSSLARSLIGSINSEHTYTHIPHLSCADTDPTNNMLIEIEQIDFPPPNHLLVTFHFRERWSRYFPCHENGSTCTGVLAGRASSSKVHLFMYSKYNLILVCWNFIVGNDNHKWERSSAQRTSWTNRKISLFRSVDCTLSGADNKAASLSTTFEYLCQIPVRGITYQLCTWKSRHWNFYELIFALRNSRKFPSLVPGHR